MTALFDVMTKDQDSRYTKGEIKLVVTKLGMVIATDGVKRGYGRSARLAIEAMK